MRRRKYTRRYEELRLKIEMMEEIKKLKVFEKISTLNAPGRSE
jgi:hypothetical protein